MRETGRVSALIEKDTLPDGIGYNYLSLVVNKSNPTGGDDWRDVVQENGTVNNCVPNPSTVSPSLTEAAYNAQEKLIRSFPICFEDARKGYLFKKQVEAFKENMAEVIVDTWEDRDKLGFFSNAAHKIVYNAALSENQNVMPGVAPTSQLTEDLLDYLYTRIIQNGGAREAYAQANGVPLITAIMSMEQSRAVIRQDASVRQDFRFAEMGKGSAATLMKSWGIDKAYAGFMHVIDNRMPRWTLSGGVWTQVPYYINGSASTIGTPAIVNPAYYNAPYEDVYLWHPQVVKRLVPKPIGSVGADTTGEAINWNGSIVWRNILNEDTNPLGNIGRWYAPLMAAYEPIKVDFGYVVRVLRCTQIPTNGCVY
jgi:hypothetical protein